MAFIGNNPKFNSGTYTPLAADPSTPTEGMIFYSDGTSRSEGLWQYKDGSWQQIGNAAEGGINYILNSGAEGDTSGWATYADTPGAEPIDGTGGSPVTALNRTTTASEILRGIASFEEVKDAANRQGEGSSYDFTIDRQDRGKVLEVSFDYAASANFVSGDSSDVRVFIYDVTNASLITPTDNKLISSAGRFASVFNAASDSTSYRLILHTATTNASAWDLFFDNVRVGPKEDVQGMIGTDWQQFTMNIDAVTTAPTKGTIVRDNAYWRRVGDSMEIRYEYAQSAGGSVGSGVYLFEIPGNYSIDLSKISSSNSENIVSVGSGVSGQDSGGLTSSTRQTNVTVGDATHLAVADNSATVSGFNMISSASFGLSGEIMHIFHAKVPIVGWTSQVSLANGSVFNISNLLANGTRVTSDPTALGEYRSQLRNAGARTYTDTNGAPAISPTAGDGIALYAGNAFSAADTNNEPTRFKIFVGKNKYVTPRWYTSANRTGFISVDYVHNPAGTAEIGYSWNYDPSTGIFEILRATVAGGTATSHFCGVQDDGDVFAGNNMYFDVVVSENAQAVGMESARSQIRVHTGTGFGSVNANRRFTTILQNLGSAITYADSATDGASFTINEDGVYAMDWVEIASGANFEPLITLNEVDPTAVTVGERIVNGFIPNGERDECNATILLSKGDVVRLTGSNTSVTDSNDLTQFRIVQVSK